ncbi:MAG: peptidylprolyl isomerase [Reyranellaceae bacterium]
MTAPPVSVNGRPIAEADIAREMQNHPAAGLAESRSAAALALVVRELLLEQAAGAGHLGQDFRQAEPEEQEEAIQLLLSEAVSIPEADAETCRRYWQANRARFRSPDLVEARHILIAAAPDDEPARAAAKQKARELIAMLQQNRTAFGALAREHSACPSKDQGGALGQVTRGDTVPELETFLFNLEPDQLCPLPVESRYGVHVVLVDQREEGRELPFESVREQVAAMLRQTAWRNGVRQYLQLLAGQARIEGVEVEGARTPLVQ